METELNTRFLGLDYGTKTVGVAISDGLFLTAQGVETIKRERPTKLRQTLARIEELVSVNKVSGIVLGYPKHLNNTEGDRCKATAEFADMLFKRLSIPIFLCDERLSSVESDNTLSELGVKDKDKKKVIDEMAAMLILQGFIDMCNAGHTPKPYLS